MSDLHGMEWAELCQEAQRLQARVEALEGEKKITDRAFIAWFLQLPIHTQHKMLQGLFDQLKCKPAATEQGK